MTHPCPSCGAPKRTGLGSCAGCTAAAERVRRAAFGVELERKIVVDAEQKIDLPGWEGASGFDGAPLFYWESRPIRSEVKAKTVRVVDSEEPELPALEPAK